MSNYNPLIQLWSGRVASIDYQPASAVSAGSIITIGNVQAFANVDIAAAANGFFVVNGGCWAGNKDAGAWVAGDPVYWNPTGTPNVALSVGSGSITQTPTATSIQVGIAIFSPNSANAAASADQFGYFVKVGASGANGAVSVAAAGTNQTTAAVLTSNTYNLVTGANATVGVILPSGGCNFVNLKNADAANSTLPVYPPLGGKINGLSANGAITLGAKTAASFFTVDGVNFATIPLLPS